MSKPTLNQRIEWLKAARGPYLNFLRNLTPQVLMATLAWIVATKIDLGRMDADNAFLVLSFITFFGAFLAAFVANSTLLYDEAFGELRHWRKRTHIRIKNEGLGGISYGKAMCVAFWQERFAELATYLYQWGQMAVLYPRSFIGEKFEKILAKHDVPVDFVKKNNNRVQTERDAVRLLTMHNAKGLEFPCVAIGGLGELKKLEEIDDDIRLTYVAITRATHEAFITYSNMSELVGRLVV